jgi:hypothetical protein
MTLSSLSLIDLPFFVYFVAVEEGGRDRPEREGGETSKGPKTLEIEGPVVRPWYGARERQESGLRKPA